jgi:phage tail-like protein
VDQLRYFVFNKKKDYEFGYRKDIRITKQGLALEEGVSDSGVFISRLLDSGEEGNQWHRAVIESEGYGDDSIRFYFYCSDDPQVSMDGRECYWEEIIGNREISPEKKHSLMEPFLVHNVANPQDIMLYHARGRYLWMEIQLFCQAGFLPEIHHMKLYAGNRSFLSYLPMIYQTGGREDFLGRFLGMFEAVYQDLEERIADSARQLDPMAAEPEFLRWLARWVGIFDAHLWHEEKLRLLLEGIVKKNLIRGTREYMEHMIGTFTGERPFFLEYGEIEQYRGNDRAYQSLIRSYAHGPYEVSVLVREQAVPSLREQYALKKMIENIQPAHIRMHLIILRPGIYLGQNVYAGVNSMLVTYEHANLNGVAAIPSIVGAAEAGAEEEKKDEEFEKLSI